MFSDISVAKTAHGPNAEWPCCDTSHAGAHPKHMAGSVQISPQICPPLKSGNNRASSLLPNGSITVLPWQMVPPYHSSIQMYCIRQLSQKAPYALQFSPNIKECLKKDKMEAMGMMRVLMPVEQLSLLSLLPRGCVMAHTVQQRVLHDTKSVTATRRGITAR